ncbi:tandem-95 repeat protein [Mycolicibacterium sp. S2-37]|uniref:Ig-like domain-containing protein n=1 Tax=Mycolicibacterium sp. S2-37 TaxID=2810297 RepID=UPI001A94E5C3|nr:Ig-like domain-containing protein [Mycolicibacterium sp. S2-37]MBO0678117.1 tandem-95 repeat protein [Mycolicibacterium sp. S2-37]
MNAFLTTPSSARTTTGAVHVGRVGALAVALGVGMAIATGVGAGIATAAPETSSDPSSNSGRSGVERTAASSSKSEGGVRATRSGPGTGAKSTAENLPTKTDRDNEATWRATKVAVADDTTNTRVARIAVPPETNAEITVRNGAGETAPSGRRPVSLTTGRPTIAPKAGIAVERQTTTSPIVATATAPPTPTSPDTPRPTNPLSLFEVLGRELQRTFFNRRPQISDRSVQLDLTEDGSSEPIALRGYDPDGDRLNYTVTGGGPAYGTVTIDQTTGKFVYTPDAGFARTGGTDTFTVTVQDTAGRPHLHGFFGIGGTHRDTATITVRLLPTNKAPNAAADTFAGPEDRDVTGNVLINDVDPDGGPLTARLARNALNGTVTLNPNGVFTYRPNANYNGPDSFTYTVRDAAGTTSAPTTVTLTVTPVSDPPYPLPDSFTGTEDTDLTGNVLTNDLNPDGGPLTTTIGVDTTFGVVTLNPDGSFVYRPNADYSGPDYFSYTLRDAAGTVSGTATVVLTVTAVNDAPIAVSDAFSGPENTDLTGNVLGNDTDPDGPAPLTAQLVAGATNGQLTLEDDGSFVYQPHAGFVGQDSFTYTVRDAAGAASALATVTITVRGPDVNHFVLDDPALTQTGRTAQDHNFVAVAFTALENGTYVFGQTESSLDSQMWVYNGTFDPSAPDTNEIGWNDDVFGIGSAHTDIGETGAGCAGRLSRCPQIRVQLTSGQRVVVALAPYMNMQFAEPQRLYVHGPVGGPEHPTSTV